MNEEHQNYRPKSPDLSALQPPPPPKLSRIPSYPDSSFPPGYSFSARGSYDASPFFSPQTATPTTSYFGPRIHSSATPQQYSPPPFTPITQSTHQQSPPQAQLYNNPAPPPPPPNFYHNQPTYQPNYEYDHTNTQPINQHYPLQAPSFHQSYDQPYGDMPRTRQQRAEEQQLNMGYDPHMPPRQEIPVKPEQFAPTMPVAPIDPAHGIDVRTKFPVARIKRIMQADEDVGKVAQATPTAVAKALELFMIALVSKGAAEAKANRSKRVTAQHLKAGLMKDGTYDFLTDICESIPDEGSKKGRAKSEAKSEDSEDDIAPKKKGKGGKKRKADTSDDSD